MWISLYHKGALCDACVYYKGNGKKGNKYIITNFTNRRQYATRVASIYGWRLHMMKKFRPHFQNGTAVLQFWPKLIKGIKHLTRQKAGFKLLELGFWDLCLWISNTKKKYNFFVHHTSGRHEIFVWPCLDNIHLQGIFATHW